MGFSLSQPYESLGSWHLNQLKNQAMKIPLNFDDELKELKTQCEHDSFVYDSSTRSFSQVCREHFWQNGWEEKCGIYIVRQQSTNRVLYIGKSGTITSSGVFKGQNLLRRLKNVRGNDISADNWFGSLLQEMGSLKVECLFLTEKPISPILAESILLQAYLNEYGKLPVRNKGF